jgi:hypothetical protein
MGFSSPLRNFISMSSSMDPLYILRNFIFNHGTCRYTHALWYITWVFTSLFIQRKLEKTRYTIIFTSLCISISQRLWATNKSKFNGPKKHPKGQKIPVGSGYQAPAQLIPRCIGLGMVARANARYTPIKAYHQA